MSSAMEDKMLRKLDKLEQEEGELPGFIQLYRQLLRLQSQTGSQIITPKPKLTKSVISKRLSQGIPLLSFEDWSLDWEQVQGLLQEVIRIIAQDSPDIATEVQTLGNVLSEKDVLEEVVRAWYEGSSLVPIATRLGIDSDLLGLVAAAAVKPFLTVYSEVLLPKVDQESWRQRYCPVCGGNADFAYLDEERGSRWLLCSRCDAEWIFQRLECPYCGSQNQNDLSYFSDDKGLYRLYVCEQCKRYLKTIDLRQAKSEVLMPLERLLTYEFDLQAREDGYRSFAEGDNGESDEETLS
jgi:FdhE protein